MQNILKILLTFALLFSSCTRIRSIRNEESPESFYSRINNTVQGQTVTIVTMDGDELEGTHLTVAADSIRWVDAENGKRTAFPTDQIQLVRIYNHVKGAIGGLGTGLAIGLGSAFIYMIVYAKTNHSSGDNYTGIAVLFLGASLGIIGGIWGGIAGHKDDYIIYQPEKESLNSHNQ
jgi:hypothetical protein